MKKKNPPQKTNKNILKVTYAVAVLFVCFLGYFAFFLTAESEDVINNPYNARLDSFSDRILRGRILSNDRTVLAETSVGEDGGETRVYPYGALFSPALGYTTKGKTGIESLANFYLLSSHVNLFERVINELYSVKSAGDDVVTTLDVGLQQAASEALGGRYGAVVVMEPDTGKILAMVSKPSYDPNRLEEEWQELTAEGNTSAQLLNRATQGLYPPGSIFKIVTLLEYLREHPQDYEDYQFDCRGIYRQEPYQIKCYHETVHGHQNLEQAFANSCNGAFASLGQSLNLNQFYSLSEQLLFHSEFPLSVPYNKSSFQMKEGAGTWEIMQTSIGQGTTQMTPIHAAMITSAIAHGGLLMKPYFLDYVESSEGETVKKFLPEAYGNLMTLEESTLLTRFMRNVVETGTGSALRTDAYTVAGKTGSAEFETGRESHAWFTGFAPAENPRLVVTVIVEEGGSGGKAAAPIARAIFDTYFQ